MHDSRQHNHKSIYSPRKDFTLIEILLVVSVMLIVLAFTTPIFSELLRGNAVDEAASMISSQLALARAQATRFRKPVALVFPTEGSDDKSLSYTACRPYFVEENRWLPNSQWTQIPLGAVILQVDDDYSEELIYNNNPGPSETTWTINPDWITPPYDQLFSPDHLSSPSSEITVSTKECGDCRAIVFYPDGSSTQAMYVTLVQSIVNPTDHKPDLKRTVYENLRVLKINPYTGKANFIY